MAAPDAPPRPRRTHLDATRRGRAVVAVVALTALGTAWPRPGTRRQPDASVETVASATPAGPGSPAGAGTTEPAATPLPGLAEAPSDPRPNVVVLMTDDMRDDDLRFMPNVRRLIGERASGSTNILLAPAAVLPGARVVRVPGCTPTTTACGRNGRTFGFRALDDRHTLATWLHEAGLQHDVPGQVPQRLRPPATPRGRPRTADYVPPGWTDWRGSVDSRAGLGLRAR